MASSPSSEKLTSKQLILLLLSTVIMMVTFLYTYLNFPPILNILEQLEFTSTLSKGAIFYFKWFWLITVIPPLLLVLILVFHKNRKTVGTAMFIFAVCSSVLMCGMTFYIQKKFQDLSENAVEQEMIIQPNLIILNEEIQ